MYIGELGDVEVASSSVVDDEEILWTKKREIKNTMNIAIAIGLTKKLLSPVHISCKNIAWIASIKTTIPNVAIAIVFESATLLRIGSFLQNTSRTPIIKILVLKLPLLIKRTLQTYVPGQFSQQLCQSKRLEIFRKIKLLLK